MPNDQEMPHKPLTHRLTEDPVRSIAATFSVVATLAAIPGLWVLTTLIATMIESAVRPHELDIVRVPILASLLLGFAQLGFF